VIEEYPYYDLFIKELDIWGSTIINIQNKIKEEEDKEKKLDVISDLGRIIESEQMNKKEDEDKPKPNIKKETYK